MVELTFLILGVPLHGSTEVMRGIPIFDHKANFELNFLSDNCNSGPRDLTLCGVAGCALPQML